MSQRDALNAGLVTMIVLALTVFLATNCAPEPGSDLELPTPARACDMIAQLCPERLARIDGYSCEQQVVFSTPPEGAVWNKTTANVEFGYGKNPRCIAGVYQSQAYQKRPFLDGCYQLRFSCECGKYYPVDPTCNQKLGE